MSKVTESKSTKLASCNTPAQNTEGKQSEFTSCIDYLSVTFPESISFDYLCSHVLKIPEEDFEEMPRGGRGYRRLLKHGNVSVYMDGTPEMGMNVDMSGQGVRELESRYFKTDATQWPTWFGFVHGLGAHFARIDIAIDERGDAVSFTPAVLGEYVNKGLWRSRFKGGNIRQGFGNREGTTIYFGSETSRVRVRVYDKAAERKLENDEEWTRTEVQFRHERAEAVASILETGTEVGTVCRGFLADYLNFLVASESDSNKARWELVGWWENFLDGVAKLRLCALAPEKSVEKAVVWVFRQVSTSLAMMNQYYGKDGFLGLMQSVLVEGQKKMKPHHWALVKGC